ncbi:MFS transporter [Ferrimonas lipolytica]|uniref:MFS transporter n=1 Tax=Ferrimonas lipolytica TaxID=2724191 RepID=A0A6H1UAW9_9GAMM|nr:MFS transporter [Ferrimonas lipolytica]QIZ75730.1 MFS transporter [Ferrimonas lipolytica]
MSLVSMPFVGTGADTALHVVAGTMLVILIAAVAVGFWKLHELPVHKAKETDHQQIALISVLTWIGFVWHYVWVLAVIIAFVDVGSALRRIRDIWREPSKQENDHA